MRRPPMAIPCLLLLLALALSACGSAGSGGVAIRFKSPALDGESLPALYTCDGRDVSPPVEWGAVPSTSRELALFMLALTPNPSTHGYLTTIEWALAGVNPALHRLAAGELPPGAHLGLYEARKGRFLPQRYSVCPPRGRTVRYQFALYSVPAGIVVPEKFLSTRLLALLGNPESSYRAIAGGAFVASYTRR